MIATQSKKDRKTISNKHHSKKRRKINFQCFLDPKLIDLKTQKIFFVNKLGKK